MKLTRRFFASLPFATLLSRTRGATALLAAPPPAPAVASMLPGRARAVSVASEIQRQIYTRKALERYAEEVRVSSVGLKGKT